MSSNDMLTDDYVADLLAKDAKDCSLKYSAMGMDAYRSDKKPANMPKPNTRFLRRIVKNTDTHNKNLLAKEAAESKARLEDLEHTEEVKRLKTNPDARDIRRRQMGDIHAILGGGKSRKRDDEGPSRSQGGARESKDGDKRRSANRDSDLFRDCDSRRHHGRLAKDDDGHRRDRPGERSSRRTRDRDSGSEDKSRRRHNGRRRHRSRSPNRRRRSSESEKRSRHRHRSPLRAAESPPLRSREGGEDSDSGGEIGPMPAPKPRGRGALAGSSGIDRRFSETYDPKTDVQMDDGSNDGWDDAVEAFRDRQKLRQNQDQRLKSAGFGDEAIQKMLGGADNRSGEDVAWSKAGEKREWDKGKVAAPDDVLPTMFGEDR